MPCCSFGTKEGPKEGQSLPPRLGLGSDGLREVGKETWQKESVKVRARLGYRRARVALRHEGSLRPGSKGATAGWRGLVSRAFSARGTCPVLAPEEERERQ